MGVIGRLEEIGIQLKNKNKQQKTKCPKCGGENSLSVNAYLGLYNCHLKCGFKGKV